MMKLTRTFSQKCNLWRTNSGRRNRSNCTKSNTFFESSLRIQDDDVHKQGTITIADETEDSSNSSCGFLFANTSLDEALRESHNDPACTELAPHDFVWTADRPDIEALQEVLKEGPWKLLTFRETVPGTEYKRWLDRKQSLKNQLCTIASEWGIAINFEGTVEVNINAMKLDSIVKLFEGLEQDGDIVAVLITGALSFHHIEPLFGALTDLLCFDDRSWKDVTIKTSFRGKLTDQFPQWKELMESTKKFMDGFSKLYNIPIDLETR